MKRHPLPPETGALAAFVATVVLALLAAASLLMPEVAVQSVDSMSLPPNGLDQLLPPQLFE